MKAISRDSNLNQVFNSIEKGWNEGVFLRSEMVDMYGWISKCLGKHIIYDNDDTKTVMLGSDGKLYYLGNVTGEDNEDAMEKNIETLVEFNRFCQDKDASFLFVIAPDKYNSEQVCLPLPTKDYLETTRRFSNILKEEDVACLNIQEELFNSEDCYSDGFFITDHHWNIHTAFWAFSKIVERLWPEEQEVTDPNNFITTIATTDFLGSMGIRTGHYFAGVDSVELIAPRFETDFLVEYRTKTRKKEIVRSGSFLTSIIDSSNLGYNMYITSDNNLIHIVNRRFDGDRRALLIKDSFGVPIGGWLPLMCRELWIVDIRYPQTQSVCAMIESYGIDDVVMVYNPGMLGSDMFRFKEISKGK